MKRFKLKVNPKTIKKNKASNGKELNIFDLGTLIQFETHAWQARKRLPTKIAKQLTPNAEKTLVRANKDLIDKSHLQEINGIIADARNFVWTVSNPFPIKGIHFINNDIVPNAKEKLDGYISKLKKAVNEFAKKYNKFIDEAESYLGADQLFNASDYPTKSDIRNRFSISYRFFDLAIPSAISEEMRKEETNNFQSLMKQTQEMGVLALREGFSEIVTHLNDTLSGKLDGEKKRLNQNSINKISEFLNTFKQRNVFNDHELEKIINDAILIVGDVSKDELSKDEDLTKIINSQLSDVQKELDKCITTYKRKVSFI
jgi:hypothetical protein